MKAKTVITRKQYMVGEASHEDYYGQFVTPRLKSYVVRIMGLERILASNCEHFNDIPMSNHYRLLKGSCWDDLHCADYINRKAWREANGWDDKTTYPWSPCCNVCIGKAAALAIKLEHS